MLYCTRNEQSIVTFFSNLMQFSAYGIYQSGRSAAEHNFNYSCYPRPHFLLLGNLIMGAVPPLLDSAVQKPKLAFCMTLEFQREATLLI